MNNDKSLGAAHSSTGAAQPRSRTDIMREAYTVDYRGCTIRVKGDFGDNPFLIDGMPCAWGYVVTRGHCNVMPGATWFQTVKDAKRGIDALVMAEAMNQNDTMIAEAFWTAIRESR